MLRRAHKSLILERFRRYFSNLLVSRQFNVGQKEGVIGGPKK
jgi:hypothetical protein